VAAAGQQWASLPQLKQSSCGVVASGTNPKLCAGKGKVLGPGRKAAVESDVRAAGVPAFGIKPKISGPKVVPGLELPEPRKPASPPTKPAVPSIPKAEVRGCCSIAGNFFFVSQSHGGMGNNIAAALPACRAAACAARRGLPLQGGVRVDCLHIVVSACGASHVKKETYPTQINLTANN